MEHKNISSYHLISLFFSQFSLLCLMSKICSMPLPYSSLTLQPIETGFKSTPHYSCSQPSDQRPPLHEIKSITHFCCFLT